MKLRNLQALRGIAAGIVLLIHALPHDYGLDWFLYKFWWIGPAGVDIFFVLSGFIVCYSASRFFRDGMTSASASATFLAKRALRIFPVYWVALAFAWLIASHVDLAPNPIPLPEYSPIRYILLLTIHNNKVRPAWSLAYEVYFYLMLAVVMFWRPKDIYRIVAAWAVASAAAIGIAACIPGFDPSAYVFLSPLILEFAAGCAVAFVVAKGVSTGGWQALASGTLLFIVGCWVNMHLGNWVYGWRAVLFGPSAALVVYGLVGVESRGFVIFPRWLERFGDASYSIYIWHYMLIMVMLSFAAKHHLPERVPGWSIVAAIIAVCVAWGFCSYHLIERPIQQWSNRYFAGRANGQAAAAEGAVVLDPGPH
jgi:exopolysaccharide production protein ExoZ